MSRSLSIIVNTVDRARPACGAELISGFTHGDRAPVCDVTEEGHFLFPDGWLGHALTTLVVKNLTLTTSVVKSAGAISRCNVRRAEVSRDLQLRMAEQVARRLRSRRSSRNPGGSCDVSGVPVLSYCAHRSGIG